MLLSLGQRWSQNFELSDALARPLLTEVDVTQENRFVGCFFLAEEGNDIGNVGHIRTAIDLSYRQANRSPLLIDLVVSPARSSQSYSPDRHAKSPSENPS